MGLFQAHPDRLPGTTLTVILRDDSPMIHCNDKPAYRSVRLTLTNEQRNMARLACTGTAGGSPIYESVSCVFIEPIEVEETDS